VPSRVAFPEPFKSDLATLSAGILPWLAARRRRDRRPDGGAKFCQRTSNSTAKGTVQGYASAGIAGLKIYLAS